MNDRNEQRLFWACFICLIATAFGFIIRAMVMDEWAKEFGLSNVQKGEIFGVGLWPFAISIVLFSLVIDRIGYGRAIAFAFICHALSTIITMCTPLVGSEMVFGQKASYWMLYVGNFIVALGNGTVEAVINPVVATMFPREKTKWLNILHAGWPGGLVLGGLLTLLLTATLGAGAIWQYKVALLFLPVISYGILMLGCKFPVNERVAAGVPYREMLQEAGVLGALVVVFLMVLEVGRLFGQQPFSLPELIVGGALLAAYGAYVLALGRPMFFILLLIMLPLATTELGTDSWITGLMEPSMKELHLDGVWVLVYTSAIMMVLRFFAGPIVHKISPLGLLAVSSAVAALGLLSLSAATGVAIFLAATLYGFGKTFFWPTMLGVVSEQFPKGGALTLNTTGGVGMLGVGVVGAAFFGIIIDNEIDRQMRADHPALHAAVQGQEQVSVFGTYRPIDGDKLALASKEDQAIVGTISSTVKKNALATVALLPTLMLVCNLGLLGYFHLKGGYKAEHLTTAAPSAAKELASHHVDQA